MKINLRYIALYSSIAFIASCGGSNDGSQTPPTAPAPATNNPPVIDSASLLQFVDENVTDNAFPVIARDVEAPSLTFSMGTSPDEALFEVNESTGTITTVPGNLKFDFENPVDADGDNDYLVTVSVSDGIDTTTETITIRVNDVDESEFCFESREVSVTENTTQGPIDRILFQRDDGVLVYLSRPPQVFPERFSNFFRVVFGSSPFGESGDVVLVSPLDYEATGSGPIQVRVNALYDFTLDRTESCLLNVNVTDVPGTITSGARLSGFSQSEVDAIEDLDGDGAPELWAVSGDIQPPYETAVFGTLVFGGGIRSDINDDGVANIDVTNNSLVRTLSVSLGLSQHETSISNDFKLEAIDTSDVNGNGKPDLLLSLSSKKNATDQDDLPIGYILFDTVLQDASTTELNLSELTTAQGLTIIAQGVTNSRGVELALAELTGDSRSDLVVSLPDQLPNPNDTSPRSPQVFIVTNATMNSATASGSLNILDLQGGEGARLTGAGRDSEEMRNLSDLDDSGADELMLRGLERVYVIRGEDVQALIDTGTVGSNLPEQSLSTLNNSGQLPNFGKQFVPDQFGDIDGDGITDLALGLNQQVRPGGNRTFGVLTLGSSIAGMLSGQANSSESLFLGREFVNGVEIAFIGDLNNDGGDELLIKYREELVVNASNPNLPVVSIPDSRHFILNSDYITRNLFIGQFLDIQAAASTDIVPIENLNVGSDEAPVFSSIGDIDGDGLNDLYVSRELSNTGYILLGKDMRAALIAGTSLDFSVLLNDEE